MWIYCIREQSYGIPVTNHNLPVTSDQFLKIYIQNFCLDVAYFLCCEFYKLFQLTGQNKNSNSVDLMNIQMVKILNVFTLKIIVW